MSVGDRLAEVRSRIIAAGGDPDAVTVVAVTKGFGPETVAAARAAGLTDLGENYVQELERKARSRRDDAGIRWHFVGRIQRNKVRRVAPLVHLWHGVDRASAGREIARRRPGASVLVQVDATGEPAKGGCPPEDVPALVADLRDTGLEVRGVMAMGPQGSLDGAHRAFELAGGLADELELPERSFGMTEDLEAAVEAGTTMVRVGRALFGPRPTDGEVGH